MGPLWSEPTLPQHIGATQSADYLLAEGFSSADPTNSSGLGERELSSSFSSRPLARRKAQSPDLLDALERQELQQMLRVDGKQAQVTLTAAGITWVLASAPASSAGLPSCETMPFSEMLCARHKERCCMSLLRCLRVRRHLVEVLTFRRGVGRRCCEWSPRTLLLGFGDEETAQDWQAALTRGIDGASAGRPKSLLVVLNPSSGHSQSRRVWRHLAFPVFAAAGIKTSVQETRRVGHATEIVAGMTTEQLRAIDGVMCVGGDGVWHEVMNGLLAARAAAGERGDSDMLAALCALRMAHLPAGSTDAVACTLHGTRSVFAAAVHAALGDSTPLDVLRVDTAVGTKFATCCAAYGFLADVTSGAEQFRWMGPVRYDLMGAAKLAMSRAYPLRIRYLEGEVGRALSKHSHLVCGAKCTVCRTASFAHARRRSQQHMSLAAATAAAAVVASSSAADSSQHASPSLRRGWHNGAGLPAAASSGSLTSSGAASEPQSPAYRAAPAAAVAAGGEGGLAGAMLDDPGCSSGAAAVQFAQPAAEAGERHEGEEWQVIEGEFCSIMLIVMPCKSAKTREGMARFGHLADGRLKMVLVRKCSPLQYLRFLLSMSRHGCAPGELPYVTVLDAVAVSVEPLTGSSPSGILSGSSSGGGGGGGLGGRGSRGRAPLSCWNLDGELVRGPDMRMSAEVHHGLLRVFSRGVEQ